MYICPICKTEQKKRKGKECGNCGQEIIIYEGKWYDARQGTPIQVILKVFEQEVSTKLSTPTRRIVWDIPRGSEKYKRESGLAKIIFDKCGRDLELTKEALQEAFYGTRFAWKQRQSLASVLGDLSFILAILRAKREESEAEKNREKQAIESVLRGEDIFA